MRRLARYAIVGIASNLAGYLAYLLLTWLAMGPKSAMSIVYITAASVGFFGNRQWTFAHRGRIGWTAAKYAIAHACGYSVNFVMLYFFVDKLGWPHPAVQAAAIVVVAGMMFVVFKAFVFVDAPRQ